MNVVLYLRFSSDKQNEQSIEGQRRVCEEFCQRKGYTIVDEYVDRALSASKNIKKRIAFQQMIADSALRQFEAVIVYKLDRFSRQRSDSAIYKSKLAQNGVKVISATENISNNPEGIILEAMLEGIAEFYSAELSQKVERGMRETALKCNSTGGQLPLGYKVKNKKYVIDETEADIVRKSFQMYADGKSVAQIVDYFNENGYRTSKGAKFNKNSFNKMLQNEKYIGVYKYKDIRIEGGMPAIIDKKLFDEVQYQLDTNKKARARKKAKTEYLLTTKLYCGHCEAMLVGECGTNGAGKTYHYYTCHNRKFNHNCEKKPVPKDWIENTVINDCLEMLTPEIINQIADMALTESNRQLAENGILNALQQKEKELTKSINNLLKVAENAPKSKAIANRINELETELDNIQFRILEEQKDVIILSKPLIVNWLNLFKNGDINDEAFKRRLVNLLINKITVYDNDDNYYTFEYLFNLTENAKIRIKKAMSDCSDLHKLWSPLKYYPNIIYTGFAFGFLRAHQLS